MAALNRPTKATYTLHEKVTVDTLDREDHTFCGIMFPIKCKDILPVNHIVINSIAVRGRLGPLTVWVTNEGEGSVLGNTALHPGPKAARKHGHGYSLRARDPQNIGKMSLLPHHWTQIYSKTHPASYRDYTNLDLSSNPIILKPNQVRGIYIHSTLENDEAIVYDNKHNIKTHDDDFITILPGRAHVSNEVFGSTPIWGWGSPWRDNREFVGKVKYGVIYKLWNPKEYVAFGGDKFQTTVKTLFACQRRWESPLSCLPDDVLFYILNMCRWDWFVDKYGNCLENKKKWRDVRNNNLSTITDAAVAATVKRGSVVSGEKHSLEIASTKGCEKAKLNDNDLSYDEEDDESFAGEEDEEEEEEDHYNTDHTSSNVFVFQNFDEFSSFDEEAAAALRDRERMMEQRRRWFRVNFDHGNLFRQIVGTQTRVSGDEDEDEDDSSP